MASITTSSEHELYPLISALRVRTSEVQLTQVLANLAKDQAFARGFTSLVLEAARTGKDAAGKHARALPDLVGAILCTAQSGTGTESGERGRADLVFSAAGPPVVTLCVELKHRADYGIGQREKYLGHLAGHGHGRAGLVVVTGRGHGSTPKPILADSRWLGEVRWSTLTRLGLDEIMFESQHGLLREAWRLLVAKMVADGDLGISAAEFADWGRGNAGIQTATALLSDLAAPLAVALDQHLESRHLRSKMIHARNGGLTERVGGGWICLGFTLGRSVASVQLNFARPDTPDPDRRVRMVVWFFASRKQRALYSATGAARAGFTPSSEGTWTRDWRLEHASSGEELRSIVLKRWRLALRGLDTLGAFDDLPGSS